MGLSGAATFSAGCGSRSAITTLNPAPHIARDRSTGSARRGIASGGVAPGSRQVVLMLAQEGLLTDLVAAGVDVYEYKVHPPQERREHKWYRLRPSYGALHSKVLVFDGQTTWIGSQLLDRSTWLTRR